MNRVNWIRMTRANWLSWRGRSRKKRTHYLDGRIVFCADCATNRRLTFDAGRLICSSCCSEHWMFASSGILARFKDYDEEAVHTQVVVERLTKRLKKEAFFAPNAALV